MPTWRPVYPEIHLRSLGLLTLLILAVMLWMHLWAGCDASALQNYFDSLGP